MILPTDKEIDDGIRRLARFPEGKLLYRRCQLVLMSMAESTECGALLRNEGRRTFAREIKLLMDQELAKIGDDRASSGTSGQHDPDGPAVQRTGEPITAERFGLRRRVEPYPDQPHPERKA